jgi:hypothetical protein
MGKMTQEKQRLYEEYMESWDSPIVLRTDVGRFSGGALNPRTMANRDAKGTGVKQVFKCRNRVFYRKADVAQYLINQVIEKDSE